MRLVRTALLVVLSAVAANGSTITVTSALDNDLNDGVCTLREALIASNNNASYNGCASSSPGNDTIAFAIAGGGAQTISLLSPLPPLTDPVVIDGYTQPGSAVNTLATGTNAQLMIVLSGTLAGASAAGLQIETNSTTIRGLVINGFAGSAIVLHGSLNVIVGNFIGTDVSGNTAVPNGTTAVPSIDVLPAPGLSVLQTNIGSGAPADRNLISGNSATGLRISDVDTLLVAGNIIGANASGAGEVLNGGYGIEMIRTTSVRIGGNLSFANACLGECNVITSAAGGILITGATSNTYIRNNRIGLNAAGTGALTSGTAIDSNGISIIGASGTPIGGAISIDYPPNVISGWRSAGIKIDNAGQAGTFQISHGLIGTNAQGTAPIPNARFGIWLRNTTGVTLGYAGSCNIPILVVSGNGTAANEGIGILFDGSFNNIVRPGVVVGAAADRQTPIGNRGSGVHIRNSATFSANDNRLFICNVGNDSSLIAYNGWGMTRGAGVVVAGGTGNRIEVPTFANMGTVSGIGIDLQDDGPTANDICDADNGPNLLLNKPVLTRVGYRNSSNQENIDVAVALDSGPGSYSFFVYRVSFDDDHTQSRNLIAETSVTVPAAGCSGATSGPAAGFIFPYPLPGFATAVTFDAAGNTSELSDPVYIVVPDRTDIDGNRKADLFWRHAVTGSNSIWFMDGAAIGSSAARPQVTDTNWQVVAFADFNNDYSTETIWRNLTTGATLWWWSSLGFSANVLPTVPDPNWKIVATSDVQVDGTPDIIWHNTASGDSVAWVMSGGNLVSSFVYPPVPNTDWEIVGNGDFQLDGRRDLLWRNKTTGENAIWFLSSTSETGAALPAVVDTNWHVAAVADLNGDFKADVLWRNIVSGGNVVWLMNGATVVATAVLPPQRDLNWQMVRAADFNDDQRADLFWRNRVSGANAIWLMDGPAVTSVVDLPAVPDTNWRVAGPP